MTEKDMRPQAEIEFDVPIEIDGQKITKITMRRPKVRDSLIASEQKLSQPRQILYLYAALCDVPMEYLEELDEIDFKKVEDQYAGFTGRRAESSTQ